MLYRTIAALLIASIAVTRIQAEENGERRGQPSETPHLIRKFRAYLKLKSFDSSQPTNTPTRTKRDLECLKKNNIQVNFGSVTCLENKILYGVPSSHVNFGSVTIQKNNKYFLRNPQAISSTINEEQRTPNGGNIQYGSTTLQINNTFYSDTGAENVMGWHVDKEDNDDNSEVDKEDNDDNPEVDKEDNDDNPEVDKEDNDENAEKQNRANGQTSLSFNVFYSCSYFLIILIIN